MRFLIDIYIKIFYTLLKCILYISTAVILPFIFQWFSIWLNSAHLSGLRELSSLFYSCEYTSSTLFLCYWVWSRLSFWFNLLFSEVLIPQRFTNRIFLLLLVGLAYYIILVLLRSLKYSELSNKEFHFEFCIISCPKLIHM